MQKTTYLLRLIGAIQLLLGLLYLFVPDWLLGSMGHSAAATDLHYPLAMLAARFIVYGAVLWYIAVEAQKYRLWLIAMVLIQGIDLAAGLFYTATGVVSLQLSGFPMFNAAWIIALLLWWMPKGPSSTQAQTQMA